MKVSISQPTVFPWIGYFNMINSSDVFVFLDNVRFQKQSWQMRNRLKLASKIEESEIWFHVPTKSIKRDTLIMDVLIDNNQDWRAKHLDIFQSNYGKSYREISFLQEIYSKEWGNIGDFNMEFITQCCKYLEIETKLVRASELEAEGKKSHLVLDILRKLDATDFLPNEGSKAYLEKDRSIFEEHNIQIDYHHYECKPYRQKGTKFIEKLSVLDLLFSEFENSKNFI